MPDAAMQQRQRDATDSAAQSTSDGASASDSQRDALGQAGDAAVSRIAQQGRAAPASPGSLSGVDPGVKLTPSIEAAYGILQPYLPPGTKLTSGLRTDEDQARVIENYYASRGGPPGAGDVEAERQWLIQRGMVIAAVGSSPHRTGLAFDLSGAGLDEIRQAVMKCHAEHPEFLYKDTILEHANTCLHVDLTG